LDWQLVDLVGRRLFPEPVAAPGSLWLQGVSLGEVEIAVTFAREIRTLRPDLPILATATTPAGVGLLERRFQDPALAPVTTYPFPLDLPSSVRRFFAAARPGLLVLVETELWPVVLLEAERRGVPVVLINARLSARSTARYRALRALFRRPLQAVRKVAARTAADADRFIEIGVPAKDVAVVGDLKFDRAQVPQLPFAAALLELSGGRPILVGGSLADAEIPLVLDLQERLEREGHPFFLLLAPRRPEAFDAAARLLASRGVPFVRRSALGEDGPASPADRTDVFLLDTIGELGPSYRLGTIALLGGTFAPRGGHNVLEPLGAGLPVLHGRFTANIHATLDACPGAVFPSDGPDELARQAARLLADPALRSRAAEAARALFRENRGATARAAVLALAQLGDR
jgi:3-deoxy-D-manno-octulosonic-acid transferase